MFKFLLDLEGVLTSGCITDKSTLDKAEFIVSCGEDILTVDKDDSLFINRDTEKSCVQKLLTDDRLGDIRFMDGTEKKLHLVTGKNVISQNGALPLW